LSACCHGLDCLSWYRAGAALGLHLEDAGEKGRVPHPPRLRCAFTRVAAQRFDLSRQALQALVPFSEQQGELLFRPVFIDLPRGEVPVGKRQLVQFAYCGKDAVLTICVVIASWGKKGNATAMIAEKAAAICSSVAFARISSLSSPGA
jgi:hypothetical protein